MKLLSSLFVKILCWFFLNLLLIGAVLTAFFAFQSQINLHAIFGRGESDRLRAAGMLIAHELDRSSQENWPAILARHAKIHGVDFAVALGDGSRFASFDEELPKKIVDRVEDALRLKHRWRKLFSPPYAFGQLDHPPENTFRDALSKFPRTPIVGATQQGHLEKRGPKKRFMMRTANPVRYWSGMKIPLFSGPLAPPRPAVLLAASDSMTGNGFFFDPLPWIVVAGAITVISTLLWIPMVKYITSPLVRMTRAAERIAKGNFDASIDELRSDEIGRLAKAINHMTSRLSVFVRGQRRFLADVAHELGSPIARIQFGLGALEQRIENKNRKRVMAVIEDVEHMSRLTREILTFSRAEIKPDTIELEKAALLPIVEKAANLEIKSDADLVLNIDSDVRVIASPALLTRALTNLLRNAVKYAKAEGPIYVAAEKNKDIVKIEVRDNGPGVPEHLIDQLFEPFFRPEPSRDRESGGIGLGLTIVKTCVETCGGTVSAANLHPKGFVVTILLNA